MQRIWIARSRTPDLHADMRAPRSGSRVSAQVTLLDKCPRVARAGRSGESVLWQRIESNARRRGKNQRVPWWRWGLAGLAAPRYSEVVMLHPWRARPGGP